MSRKNGASRSRKKKRSLQKPVLVKSGSVVVKIHDDPLVVNGVTYPSYVVDYYANGKRHRHRRNTPRKARVLADSILGKLVKGEIEALQLTGEDRRIYLLALENLKDLGVGLDAATREYAEAKEICKNADLREVARFRQRYAQTELKKATVPDLVQMLLTDLERDRRSEYHIRDLEVRLGRFAKAFPDFIDEVRTKEIDEWLGDLRSLSRHGEGKGKPIKGRTRNNYRNAVVELFNYAQTHDYLPKGIPTEAQATKTVEEGDKRDNEIFEVPDMGRLLNDAAPRLIPSMVIKAFSGVRTEEVALMDWNHISLKKGYIILPRAVTKKKRRRIIPIWPNLRKWLEPFDGLSGRICLDWSTPQTVFQAWDRAAGKLKIRAGANRFRNSYSSDRVAQTGDVKKVSRETGNSPEMIEEEYLEIATEEDADAWFKISPSAERLAELRAYAAELRSKLDESRATADRTQKAA